MAGHDQAQKTLKQCLSNAKTSADRTACQNAYATSENATTDGGKVFVTPDGEATIVTNGGKVFRGGKAF